MLSMNDDMCDFTVVKDDPIEPELSITKTTLAAEGRGSLGLKGLVAMTAEVFMSLSELMLIEVCAFFAALRL